MNTIRLTMAQAAGAAPPPPSASAPPAAATPLFHGVFAIFGHGNVAGIGEALAANRKSLADVPRAQRAGDGPCGDRLCQGQRSPAHDGLHDLGRPGRDQSRDGRGARAREPPARAAASGRHLRGPPARPGAAADRGLRRPDGHRQRLPAARVAVLGPHHAARSNSSRRCRRRSPCCSIAADCGPATLALPQDVQAEAFDYPRVLLRRARARHRAAAAGPRAARGSREATQGSRAGPSSSPAAACIMPARSEAVADFAARHGIPVAETQAGKGALAWDHACQCRRHRRDGFERRQCAAGGMRPRARARHAAAGFHDGLGQADPRSRRSPRLGQRRAPRRDQARRRSPCAATCSRRSRNSRPGSPAGRRTPAWRERTRALAGEWNQAVDAATRAGPGLPTDAQVLGAVNRALGKGATVVCAAGGLPGELHKLWRCAEPRRLPRRVRLLLHGLRDRRRPRREDGGPGRARSRSWSETAATS